MSLGLRSKQTLSGLKKSYVSDVEKIQAQNDKTTALFKGQDLENQLFENINQEKNYKRASAKIDFYLSIVTAVACSLEELKHFLSYTKS